METLVASRSEAETLALAARLARVELPRLPRLAPWVTPVELGDGRLQLRGAELAATLHHPFLVDVYRAIEPLLDGRHTVDEIAESGPPDVAGTTVLFLLKLLQANGVLQPAGDAPLVAPEWERQVAFLSHFTADAAAAQAALGEARVGVRGEGALAAAVGDALASLGVAARGDDDGDLVVACNEGAGTALLDEVNEECLASGKRWLRVALVGTTGFLGPTFVPRQTACFTCLELRSRSHVRDREGLDAYRAHAEPRDEGALAPLRTALAAEAALETARLVTAFAAPATIGRFHELSARTPARTAHDVLKVPRCPSCGTRRPAREPWDRAVAGFPT